MLSLAPAGAEQSLPVNYISGYHEHPRAYFFWDVWEADVRINEKVLSCVVFLGRDDSGSFVPYGTGFLAVKETGGRLFQHIVTARHVIEDINYEDICIRINRLHGTVEHTHGKLGDWVFHPDEAVDIAVCPTHVPPEAYQIHHIHLDREMLTEDKMERDNLGIGDEVFMAGMFTRHLGETANDPIVRIGNLSSVSLDKVETNRGFVHAFLVEARSIAGLSGSPVFIHNNPLRVMPDGEVKQSTGSQHYFLGVMQGHYLTKHPSEVVSPDEQSPGDMATGIGVVIPAKFVLDVVNLPVLKDKREAIAEKMKKENGFVEDSAKGAEPPATDENPQGKEDFNSLLDAAVSGSKPSPETS